MHMLRFIIDMESRFTPQSAMKPTTPISIETMEKSTQREQTGFGIIMRETIIMHIAATATHWMVVGITIKNWRRKSQTMSEGDLHICRKEFNNIPDRNR